MRWDTVMILDCWMGRHIGDCTGTCNSCAVSCTSALQYTIHSIQTLPPCRACVQMPSVLVAEGTVRLDKETPDYAEKESSDTTRRSL